MYLRVRVRANNLYSSLGRFRPRGYSRVGGIAYSGLLHLVRILCDHWISNN